jgi:hypothetical protein
MMTVAQKAKRGKRREVTPETLLQTGKELIDKVGLDLETREPRANLIQDLSLKIASLPAFSLEEFLKVSQISANAFRTMRKGATSNPQSNSLEGLCRYLRIQRTVLDSYLIGEITLEGLWEQCNSSESRSITAEDIINGYRLLSFDEQLKIIGILPSIFSEKIRAEQSKQDNFIDLSDRAKVRLKNLLEVSLKYTQKTPEDLLEAGVHGGVLSSIDTNFIYGDRLSKEALATLTPYLCIPIKWVEDLPLPDPNTSFEQDIDALLSELNQVASRK